MEYLHHKRIVHFDLKSAELLLGYRDAALVCKVSGLGAAQRLAEGCNTVACADAQRSTIAWTAPEIIKSPAAVTEKARARAPVLAIMHHPVPGWIWVWGDTPCMRQQSHSDCSCTGAPAHVATPHAPFHCLP
jgi:serine/threonine protein kinase